MSRRGVISLLIGCFLGLGLVWFFQSKRTETGQDEAKQPPAPAEESAEAPEPAGGSATSSAVQDSARSPLADNLNAPHSTAAEDVRILREIFAHWRTNIKGSGNPTGTNAEITAALAGDNPLDLALIPPDHPAINDDGELTDRWGTPFRFHQLSGTSMEIISAGPDRDFATDDDVSIR